MRKESIARKRNLELRPRHCLGLFLFGAVESLVSFGLLICSPAYSLLHPYLAHFLNSLNLPVVPAQASTVVPAQAGIHLLTSGFIQRRAWVPACAGTTGIVD